MIRASVCELLCQDSFCDPHRLIVLLYLWGRSSYWQSLFRAQTAGAFGVLPSFAPSQMPLLVGGMGAGGGNKAHYPCSALSWVLAQMPYLSLGTEAVRDWVWCSNEAYGFKTGVPTFGRESETGGLVDVSRGSDLRWSRLIFQNQTFWFFILPLIRYVNIYSTFLLLNRMQISTSLASQVALVVKNPPANAGGVKDTGSIPGSGTSPGEGYSNPL